jgi:hypothetical protein
LFSVSEKKEEKLRKKGEKCGSSTRSFQMLVRLEIQNVLLLAVSVHSKSKLRVHEALRY